MNKEDWDVICQEYFEEILSPFEKGVDNKVYGLLEQVKGNEKSVLEAGCGMGFLLPYLSKNFKSVLAVDFSSKMVTISQERSEGLENVDVKNLDILGLGSVRQEFDVVVAVNSIIMPDISQVDKSISLIHSKLKGGGAFIGVFPSMESALYEAMIVYEKEFKRYKDQEVAVKITNKRICRGKYDFCYGLIDFNGRQKHYYNFELVHRLKKAGFSSVEIARLSYPWRVAQTERFTRKYANQDIDELWDWTVVAKK